MKIAITGASGHIGNNLCISLIESGHYLKVLINKTDQSLVGIDAERIYGNILNKEIVDSLVKDCDCVFHTAAVISIGNEPYNLVYKVNTIGTQNIVDACIKYKVNRLVHFSSIHAFHCDDPNLVLNENNPPANQNDLIYDKSKAMGETIVLEACAKGLNAIILNPSSVVGPNDFKPSLVGQMMIKIANGKLPFLIKGGYHFVDVRDVVSAALNAMNSGRVGERYLLSSQWKSLTDIAQIISERTNKNVPGLVPTFLAWIGLPFIYIFARLIGEKPLYTKNSLKIIAKSPKIVESNKAIKELNFKPRPVKETFIDSYVWFLTNNFITKP
jgi:dihydroflavonol-4-reductase